MLGLAGLCLFALPRAEAVTITFNPATTEDYCDITVSIAGYWVNYDTPQRRWVQYSPAFVVVAGPFGWSAEATIEDMASNGGVSIGAPAKFDRGYRWESDIVTPIRDEVSVVGWGMFNGSKFRQWGAWEGAIPTISEGTQTTRRITWSVPDNGSPLPLLIASIGALCFHRRRRMIAPAPGRA